MAKGKKVRIPKSIYEELRKSTGLTQQEIVNEINRRYKEKNGTDTGDMLTLKTYQNYEQGRNLPKLETICVIADIYGVSVDYLLGRTQYTSVSNELIGNELHLSDRAIQGIRKINEDTDQKINMYGMAYSHGYNLTLNGTSKGTLDFLLSNDTFIRFMENFSDYCFPSFTVPVSYDENTGEYVAQNKSEYTYSDKLKLWYLNVASSENNPNDIMPIVLDTEFFERVAMDKITNNINSLKKDLIEERKAYARAIQMILDNRKSE